WRSSAATASALSWSPSPTPSSAPPKRAPAPPPASDEVDGPKKPLSSHFSAHRRSGSGGDDDQRGVALLQVAGLEGRGVEALGLRHRVDELLLGLEKADLWRLVVHRHDPGR